MEETKITLPERVEKLIFILAMAFLWSYSIGVERNESSPMRVKNNGQAEYSLFSPYFSRTWGKALHCVKPDFVNCEEDNIG